MSSEWLLHAGRNNRAGIPDYQPLAVQDALGLVQQCFAQKNVDAARRVQTHLVSNGLDQVSILNNHIIRLFASCGSLCAASSLFLKAVNPTLHTWDAIIAAHSALDQALEAVHLYHSMQLSGILPDRVVFLSTVKSCSMLADVQQGMLIHDHIIRTLAKMDLSLYSSLISMYSKCGFLKEAWILFEQSPTRDVVMWGAIISACSHHGYNSLVFEFFESMVQEGINGDRLIYVCLFKACENALQGNLSYDKVIRAGLEADMFVGCGLIGLFARNGSIQEVEKVFSKASRRDLVLWSAMIEGLSERGEGYLALEYFEKMLKAGESPDAVLLLSILSACSCVQRVDIGRCVHDQIMRKGQDLKVEVANTIIDMYVKGGSLEEGRRVFELLHNRSVITWDIMITGYTQCDQVDSCLELFSRMQGEGVMPANSTCCLILKASGNRTIGRMIHNLLVKRGNEVDSLVGNALVIMYGNVDLLEEAQHVFDGLLDPDVVSWSVLIKGCLQAGLSLRALDVFARMQHDGIKADEFTYSCVLTACGGIPSVELGRLIHEQILRLGFELDSVVQSALLDMYLKCNTFKDAERVFDDGVICDVVVWNTLIGGYVQHEQGHRALDCYIKMRHKNVIANATTYLCILKVCGSTGAIVLGTLIHAEIVESNFESDSVLCNTLIDMYGKCGRLHEAKRLFDRILNPNIVSWNALIAGYSQHGLFEEALQGLKDMQKHGLKPNVVTHMIVLAACRHTCEVQQAFSHFASMRNESGGTLILEHFDCLVDLLGRAGSLGEAEELLQTMPHLSENYGLTSLLSACRLHDSVERGRWCFQQIGTVSPSISPSYHL